MIFFLKKVIRWNPLLTQIVRYIVMGQQAITFNKWSQMIVVVHRGTHCSWTNVSNKIYKINLTPLGADLPLDKWVHLIPLKKICIFSPLKKLYFYSNRKKYTILTSLEKKIILLSHNFIILTPLSYSLDSSPEHRWWWLIKTKAKKQYSSTFRVFFNIRSLFVIILSLKYINH